jgi:hypothetical protein
MKSARHLLGKPYRLERYRLAESSNLFARNLAMRHSMWLFLERRRLCFLIRCSELIFLEK